MVAFGKGFSGHQHYAKSRPPQTLVEAAVAMRELSDDRMRLHRWTTAYPMATMAPGHVFLIMEKQSGQWGPLKTA